MKYAGFTNFVFKPVTFEMTSAYGYKDNNLVQESNAYYHTSYF